VPFALSGWWSAVTGGPNIDGLVTLSFMGAATAAASRLVSSGRLMAEALWLGGDVMLVLNGPCAIDDSCSSLLLRPRRLPVVYGRRLDLVLAAGPPSMVLRGHCLGQVVGSSLFSWIN